MSIIKWRPNMDDIESALAVVKKPEIKRPSPGQAGSYLEIRRQPEIIDRVFEVRPAVQSRFTVNYNPPAIAYGEANTPVIRDQCELIRMCASRRMPWMARYIRVNGCWVVAPSSRVDWQSEYELYGGRVHDTLQFSSGDTGYETCAWCGVTGRGGIRCLNQDCGAFTCHGTIYQRGHETWARCVCGRDDRLTMSHYTQTGIFPKVRAR